MCLQPLMPQLTCRCFSFLKTPSHGPHIDSGAVASTSGAPASSCAFLLKTDDRVQPGTEQGTVLSSSAASFSSQRAQRTVGAGCLVANAVSCAAVGQVQVPSQPGRAHARSTSCRPANLSRHGSHIPDAGSFGSGAARPPSLRPLPAAASEIQVRVHPCTEQGRDFAPRRSASVKPREPI